MKRTQYLRPIVRASTNVAAYCCWKLRHNFTLSACRVLASSKTLALAGVIHPLCGLLLGVGRREIAGSSSSFWDHNVDLLVMIGVFTEEAELDLDLPPPSGVHNLPFANGFGLSRALGDSLGGVVGVNPECCGLFGIEGLDGVKRLKSVAMLGRPCNLRTRSRSSRASRT